MRKFFTPFLFISLIFFITFSSIPFIGYVVNNQNRNNVDTEQNIDMGEQVKNAFIFNHKIQIEKIKENKENIINKGVENMNYSQIKKWLNDNPDLVLWNYYASYESNEKFEDIYSLTSYMFVYLNQDLNLIKKEGIIDFLININYCLISKENNKNKIKIHRIITPENINKIKNIEIIKIDINTNNNYLNSYINNHFFIFKYKLNNIKANKISQHYYLDEDSFLNISIQTNIEKNISFYFLSFEKSINSFNLSYENNFYLNNPKIIINNFFFQNNNIIEINLNILLPKKIKIEEFLSNLKIYADYKSYDNNKNVNNYKLNFKYNNDYYKYGNSNWYNATIYINNFSKEEGIIYYNFSFFYNSNEIFINEWVDNYKIITPIYPPNIKSIYYKENEYYANSFYIYIKYDKNINYQLANDLVLYYKDNDKSEYIFLKNPFYIKSFDIYKYEITFDEIGELSSFVFINSGYFEYDFLNNSFTKNYDNNNYVNTTGYKYIFKTLQLKEVSSNKLNIYVVDSKIIKKGNKYYLDSFYHSNKIWNNTKNGNLNLIKKINFNYSLYNNENNKFKKYSEILYYSEINFINYKNNIEVLYEIPTFQENNIYVNMNFSLNKSNEKYDEIYFLSKKIYLTSFYSSNINNIKIEKIKNDSITFEITYSDISKIQANNLKITYKDSNNNEYNTLIEKNLISNSKIYENQYEYTLINLKNNTRYEDFNIYISDELSSDYKYDWNFSYFYNSIYPQDYKNVSIKTKNKMLIIVLSLSILLIYIFTFIYFLIKYIKYRKSIL
ncbi:MAG: hypothetical protein HPAVJP_2440 [Candidatus Hepatoplasma vulgare]|nr:MAG: hypothetical protein HPAVJP_2440 [Candidatus Hepatoplasma sp.]